MKLLTAVGWLLVAVQLGLLDGCAHPHRKHQESAQARQLRHKLLRGMMMGEEQITGMDDEDIDEVREILPMIDAHFDEEKHERRHVIEKDVEDIAFDEHLFELPDSISLRDLINVFVNFHIRPVLDFNARVTIDVKAREIGSETFFYVASHEFTPIKDVNKIRIWFTAPSPSLILAFEVRDDVSELIINKDDEDADGKRVTLELDLAARSRKKRQVKGVERVCEAGETEQECCVMSKKINFKEIGLKNIISPESAIVSWCAGTCNNETSFEPLFGKFSTQLHTTKNMDGPCCYGVKSNHIDVMFMNEDSEVRNTRIFDVAFTECLCH
ncbi:hypothetical protein PRIPAC_72575 [Pristionchus pacificus]|uniref:TGF_BETA_2 domain-containing protein n=1 Tax=Pristionchus pacificus TaxID=54126 RepID=A0A454XJT7_PRIPA|nr:hypothetical protein PRIPAC_72575 [Pristionchus pacificus]|eukprot:PDM73231.1 hypothetical protein PRIPAC_40587 [Pristionchus pacificus]